MRSTINLHFCIQIAALNSNNIDYVAKSFNEAIRILAE